MSEAARVIDVPQALPEASDPHAATLSSFTQVQNLLGSKVMIIDDHAVTIRVIKAYLEDAGYSNFVTESDATVAFDRISAERPEVVLLDVNMPEVTGFDILRSIRQDRELEHTPVIILTSAEGADTKLQALQLGANDFLAKPADPSELALRLKNTLAAKAYQDHLAFYDALTNLPNRKLFMERCRFAVAKAVETNTRCGMAYLNLDRFKQVNDTHGHATGDALLRTVATRLLSALYGETLPGTPIRFEGVSRTGGDEFAVLVSNLDHPDRMTPVARNMQRALARPIMVDGEEFFLGSSIGIAVCPDDSDDGGTLFKHATIAMSHAKQKGGKRFEFFSSDLGAKAQKHARLESQLHRAIGLGQLELFYQPKVEVRSGRVIGVEALLRWRHPEFGLVAPDEFIPVVEESGLIEPFGEWVLLNACRQTVAWQKAGMDNLSVAVNVTSRQFRNRKLLGKIASALDQSGLEPRHLTIELTENSVMDRAERAVELLQAIKGLGVRISIDDFGTGYSSLSYLEDFPVDELKVDRSFLRKIRTDRDDAPIVNAIINMAHSLELKVVAEGVETEEQLRFLRVRRCDIYQGYLFGRPVPADELTEVLNGQVSNT
ncbi:MAG: EAL domain-containing protein [Pseudomonadota bacterium]